MSRLRDNEADFEGAVVSAAERLGLAPLFVEKDYWVTQVLRALHDQHAGAFVLKGGTSLSKGYELIERFSEDVDILIQPAKGDSAKSRERLLKTIAEHVAHTLDVEWLPAREPGRGKTPHRADVLGRVAHRQRMDCRPGGKQRGRRLLEAGSGHDCRRRGGHPCGLGRRLPGIPVRD